MSAYVLVHCDHQYQYGTCPKTLYTTQPGTGLARIAAANAGWTHRDGKDICPDHLRKTR